MVQEVGADIGTAPLAEQELRAVPVCDVILPSQSQISDEEEFRFQMPVATYGNDRAIIAAAPLGPGETSTCASGAASSFVW